MSLDLSIYDDAALEAVAPKGVVRRARRDFEAGLASVTDRAAKAATVRADGETVQIDARGPKLAQCTCPATGVCRHILLAVMVLNADAPAAAESVEDAGPTALEDLCALTQEQVQSFAGADWSAAAALAAASGEASVEQSGRNCTVEIEGAPAPVTFLAGLGLKGAAFKGPKTRTRIMVAAAALIARAKHGVALDLSAEEDGAAPAEGVSAEYLNDASEKLLHSTRMVLAGASPVAADTLFDLAISARAEAAPRLTSQIRALTKQAGYASGRMVQFEPEAFLADAARTYALVEALKRDPADTVLTGVLRRDYQPSPAEDVIVLGASRWRTEAGARGLTIHSFAPETRQWRSVVQARGPGVDPSFDPTMAFTMPVWSAPSGKALMGRVVHLPAPLVSADGSVAPTLPQAPLLRDAIPRARVLIENGAAIGLWAELRDDIATRRGSGLHRRATPLPVLLAPQKFSPLSFDDFTLNYEIEAIDPAGDAVRLVFPHESHLDARRLSETGRPPLVLAETSGDLDRPALRPISLIHDGSQGVEIINLTLERWVKPQPNALDMLKDVLPRRAAASRISNDPLADLARRALGEAATVCAGGAPANIAQVEQSCDAAGLAMLAAALRRMDGERGPATAMATAYLATEALASLSWAT